MFVPLPGLCACNHGFVAPCGNGPTDGHTLLYSHFVMTRNEKTNWPFEVIIQVVVPDAATAGLLAA